MQLQGKVVWSSLRDKETIWEGVSKSVSMSVPAGAKA